MGIGNHLSIINQCSSSYGHLSIYRFSPITSQRLKSLDSCVTWEVDEVYFSREHLNGMCLAPKWCNRKVVPISLKDDDVTAIHSQEQNWLNSLDRRDGVTLTL